MKFFTLVLMISALALAGCSIGGDRDSKIVCTFEGGDVSQADIDAMKKVYPDDKVQQQAILRAFVPVHAQQNGYSLGIRERRQIIKTWLDDYYGGDENRLQEDAKRSKTTPEQLKEELLYQNLYRQFESNYLDPGPIKRAEVLAWYQENPRYQNKKIVPFANVEAAVVAEIIANKREALLKKELEKVKVDCNE